MSTVDPDPIPPPRDLSSVLPEKFVGVFRTRRCGGEVDEAPPFSFKVTLNLKDLKLEQPLDPMPQGVPSSVQLFHDDGVAFYSDPAVDPDNITALKDLLAKLAEDFFLFRSVSMDYVYIGMYAIVPVAVLDYIEFAYDANEPDQEDNQDDQIIELIEDNLRPNFYTRVYSEPWDGYPEWFQHWDKDSFTGDCVDSHDRTPGLLMLMPGNNDSTNSVDLAAGVLTLEDGRLVRTYDKDVTISCGCSLPCGMVCTTITGPGNLKGITVTARTQPIDHVTITNGGAGYTHAPGVSFSQTNGSGGVGVAIIDGSGHVTGVNIVSGGAYIGTVTLIFNNAGTGATTGAAGTVTLGAEFIVNTCVTDGVVISVTASNAGSGYLSIPTATVAGGGGSGVVTTIAMGLSTLTIVAGGSGYVVGQIINVVGGTFSITATIKVTAVDGGGGITAATIQNGGSFTVLPPDPTSIAGGTLGTGAQIHFTWKLAGFALVDGGGGFTSRPTVTFSPPEFTGGVTALGSATISFKCCLGVFMSGRYKITTDACTPPSTLVTVVCPTNTNVTIAASGQASIKFIPCGICDYLGGFAGFGPTNIKMTGFGISVTVAVNEAPGATCILIFGIARPGSYTFELLDGKCYYPEIHTVVVGDCVASPVDLTIAPQPKSYTQRFTVKGCNNLPLQGATVTLTGARYNGSTTSNSSGIAIFDGVPADCDLFISATYPRFVTLGPTAWRSRCADGDPALNLLNFQTPVAGYVCNTCVAYPLPITMFASDSEGGLLMTVTGGVGQPSGVLYQGCHLAAGKSTVCGLGAVCRAKQDATGATIFSDGTAVIGWGFNCFLGVNTVSSTTPGYQDENDCNNPFGCRYFPTLGCCTDSDPGLAGWLGDIAPCDNGTTCHEGDAPGGSVGAFCGGSVVGQLIGTYPSVPPFSASFILTDTTGIGFPTGVFTISE